MGGVVHFRSTEDPNRVFDVVRVWPQLFGHNKKGGTTTCSYECSYEWLLVTLHDYES